MRGGRARIARPRLAQPDVPITDDVPRMPALQPLLHAGMGASPFRALARKTTHAGSLKLQSCGSGSRRSRRLAAAGGREAGRLLAAGVTARVLAALLSSQPARLIARARHHNDSAVLHMRPSCAHRQVDHSLGSCCNAQPLTAHSNSPTLTLMTPLTRALGSLAALHDARLEPLRA